MLAFPRAAAVCSDLPLCTPENVPGGTELCLVNPRAVLELGLLGFTFRLGLCAGRVLAFGLTVVLRLMFVLWFAYELRLMLVFRFTFTLLLIFTLRVTLA